MPASGSSERSRILREIPGEIWLQYLVIGHRSTLRPRTCGDKWLRENFAIPRPRPGRSRIE